MRCRFAQVPGPNVPIIAVVRAVGESTLVPAPMTADPPPPGDQRVPSLRDGGDAEVGQGDREDQVTSLVRIRHRHRKPPAHRVQVRPTQNGGGTDPSEEVPDVPVVGMERDFVMGEKTGGKIVIVGAAPQERAPRHWRHRQK
jgi:hypothetical protein